MKLADQANHRKPCQWTEGDRELLEGLLELTDAIADEAHDSYGIPCLLTKEATLKQPEPCECQLPGDFCCGVPGILAKVENCRVVPGAKVERCDLCERYPSDQAAHDKLVELGMA
ncbi:MAG: hypothetical protein K8T91_08650 [Planctomycetes bacterium]|nr:hypothetical protein [Planctomycetota bacterium]